MKLESPDLFRGFFVWHVVQERLRGSRGVVETSARDLQEDVPSANGVEMFETALDGCRDGGWLHRRTK